MQDLLMHGCAIFSPQIWRFISVLRYASYTQVRLIYQLLLRRNLQEVGGCLIKRCILYARKHCTSFCVDLFHIYLPSMPFNEA